MRAVTKKIWDLKPAALVEQLLVDHVSLQRQNLPEIRETHMRRSRKPRLYLHLGLPKTASTWLQETVFPAFESLRYLGLLSWRYAALPGRKPIRLDKVFWSDPAIWQRYHPHLLRTLVEHSTQGIPTSDVLVSDEKIAMPRIFKDWKGPERDRPEVLAEHLCALDSVAKKAGFEGVMAVVVVRRQDRWLASRYAQSSNFILGARQAHFESAVRRVIHDEYARLGQYLDYSRLRKMLIDALGASRVLMLPYEHAVADPNGFVTRLADFMDESVQDHTSFANRHNVRRGSENVWNLRPAKRSVRVPRLLRTVAGMPRRLHLSRNLNEHSIELRRDLSEEVLGVYAEPNRMVASELTDDLQKYGYIT